MIMVIVYCLGICSVLADVWFISNGMRCCQDLRRGDDTHTKCSMVWPVKLFSSKESEIYFLLGLVNDFTKDSVNL